MDHWYSIWLDLIILNNISCVDILGSPQVTNAILRFYIDGETVPSIEVVVDLALGAGTFMRISSTHSVLNLFFNANNITSKY